MVEPGDNVSRALIKFVENQMPAVLNILTDIHKTLDDIGSTLYLLHQDIEKK